jgi:hypothetical protein
MILERDHTRTTFVFDIKFVFIPSILGSDEYCKIFLIVQTVSSVMVILDIGQGHRRTFGREPSKEYHIEFRPVVVPKNIKMQ